MFMQIKYGGPFGSSESSQEKKNDDVMKGSVKKTNKSVFLEVFGQNDSIRRGILL